MYNDFYRRAGLISHGSGQGHPSIYRPRWSLLNLADLLGMTTQALPRTLQVVAEEPKVWAENYLESR